MNETNDDLTHLKSSNFKCVIEAKKIVNNNFAYYNKMMNDKMNKTLLNSIDSCVYGARAGSFIVGSVSADGSLSFAANPVMHADSVSARMECKRLSGLTPGKLYLFVKLAGGEYTPTTSRSF